MDPFVSVVALVGRAFGREALAALSLAYTLQSILTTAVLGLVSAGSTLAGQALGAGAKAERQGDGAEARVLFASVSEHVGRAAITVFAFWLLVIMPVLVVIEDVLLLMRIPQPVAASAALYIRIFASVPSLPWMASRLQAMFLRIQACVRYHVIAQMLTEAWTLSMCLLVSRRFAGAGITAVAMVQAVARFIPFACFVVVMRTRGRGEASPWSFKAATLVRPSVKSLVRVRPMKFFLGLAVPGTLGLTAEMLLFEALVPLVSLVGGVLALDAHAIAMQIAFVAYAVFVSPLATAVEVFVARSIGQGRINSAKAAVLIGTGASVLSMGLFAVLTVVRREAIARFFVGDDEQVVALTASIMPLFAGFAVCDALQAMGQGVCRGAGRQRFIFVAQVVAAVIGLVSAILLGYVFAFGLRGVWTGLFLGLLVDAVVMQAAVLRTDWDKLVSESRLRQAEDAHGKALPLESTDDL